MKTAMDSYLKRQQYLAAKQVAVKPVIKSWRVKYCGVTAFASNDIKLCWHFIKMHGLKVKPTPVY